MYTYILTTGRSPVNNNPAPYNRPAYEAGPGEFKMRMVVGYYEGEPTLAYTAFLRKIVEKAMDDLREKRGRVQWSKELSINIHACARKDRKAVLELWKMYELAQPWEEPKKDIDRRIKANPDPFLVGIIDDRIVATVMRRRDENRG